MRITLTRTLSLVCLVMGTLPAHAQETTDEAEYAKRTKTTGAIQPLGETPFGESIDLYSGGTSFEQQTARH